MLLPRPSNLRQFGSLVGDPSAMEKRRWRPLYMEKDRFKNHPDKRFSHTFPSKLPFKHSLETVPSKFFIIGLLAA